MVNSDVLYGFRLRLFSLAAELGNVREACRIFGVHPSTYYRWRGPVLRYGAGDAPAERAPTATDAQPDEPAHRAAGDRLQPRPPRARATPHQRHARPRIAGAASSSARTACGGSCAGMACRGGSAACLVAGYAAPPGPERPTPLERHVEVDHPGELVGFDCFHVGPARPARRGGCGSTPRSTSPPATSGPNWPRRRSTARRGSRASLPGGWRLISPVTAGAWSGSSPTTARSSAARCSATRCATCARRRPSSGPRHAATNGAVERVQRTILEECWRPLVRAEPRAQAHRDSYATSQPTCASTTRSAHTRAG